MIRISKFLSVFCVLASVAVSAAQAQVTRDSLDQNADQTQGNYAATNLNYLGGVGSLGMMQSAWKDPLQHMGEGQTRPGYTKYYWTPELVLPVRVREGMYTLINFPAWEVIENVYIGDGQSFNAQIQGPTSLMVYPDSSQFVGVDTNMIVFGRSGNKYVFYLQSETVNTDRITNAIIDIEVVKKKQKNGGYAGSGSGSDGSNGYVGGNGYSQDDNSADSTYTRNLQKEDWIEKIPVDPTKFRFDIEVYVPNPDDIIIAPERVWRDNIFTYIDLGEKALTAVQRPIVTLIVERSETPVGFRAAGPNNRLIIVEGMGDMVLRSGKRIVCLKLRRADSDGLENTVYAKTNEWDLQTAYASKPQNEGEEAQIEDVYGAENSETSSNENASSGFFSGSSFFGGGATVPVKSGGNSGAPYGNGGNNQMTAPQSDGRNAPSADGQTQNMNSTLNSIPKVKPIIAPAESEAGNEGAKAALNQPQLSGQVDVENGSAELVTPEYNNQQASVKVDYKANATNQFVTPDLQVPTSVKSSNNSSPVLIAPKSNAAEPAPVVSAETEALLKEFRDGKAFSSAEESNISIELGTDSDVNNLEKLWNNISKRYAATLGKYQQFYSVDTAADGQGKEVFHLRVGPVKSLEEGDNICSQLGRNGIFCSVVRIQ